MTVTRTSAFLAAPRAQEQWAWTTRFRVLVVAVFAVVAGGVLYAPAAAGHGGPYEITLTPDGAGGFQMFAHYETDGHLVEAVMDPVVEATATDGRTAGPVSLVSSAQGKGRWVTSEPLLDNGDWTVTVSTTTPEEASTTVEVIVEPLEAPVEPEPIEAAPEAAAGEADETTHTASTDGGTGAFGPVPPWAIAVLIVAALAVAGVQLMRRRTRS